MTEPKIKMHLRAGYVFTLRVEERVGKDVAVFAITDETTGQCLVEKEHHSHAAAYSCNINRYIKTMFLEEFYKHPEIFWEDNKSNKTLSLLRSVYGTFDGNLTRVLENERYLLSEMVKYDCGEVDQRTCHVETRRYSAHLITRKYHFLKGKMLSHAFGRDHKRPLMQYDRAMELIITKHFVEKQPLLTAEEVYLQNQDLVRAFLDSQD